MRYRMINLDYRTKFMKKKKLDNGRNKNDQV